MFSEERMIEYPAIYCPPYDLTTLYTNGFVLIVNKENPSEMIVHELMLDIRDASDEHFRALHENGCLEYDVCRRSHMLFAPSFESIISNLQLSRRENVRNIMSSLKERMFNLQISADIENILHRQSFPYNSFVTQYGKFVPCIVEGMNIEVLLDIVNNKHWCRYSFIDDECELPRTFRRWGCGIKVVVPKDVFDGFIFNCRLMECDLDDNV